MSRLASGQFTRLLDRKLKDVAHNTYDSLPSMRDKFYTVVKDKQAWMEFFEVGDVPDIPEFNGSLTVLGISPGYHTKIETKEFGAQLVAERKLIDDELYGVLKDRAGMLMKAAHRTMSKVEVSPFANASSAVFTYQDREENVALCSSTHPTKADADTTNGFDNAGTSALSKTTLAATRLLMHGFKSDIGERIVVGQKLGIVIPEALEDTLDEILGTPSGYDTAASTVNTEYRRYVKMVYPLLDDYDTNDWFMVDLDRMKRNLIWWERIAPEMKNTVDWQTYSLLQAVYYRIGWGYRDWRWIYGHFVT